MSQSQSSSCIPLMLPNAENHVQQAYIDQLVEQFSLDTSPLTSSFEVPFSLQYASDVLALFKDDEPKLGGVFVDFCTGAVAHRRKYGGGKGQAIAKAIGIKSNIKPTVLDATAGLGRDSFVFATLGCTVHMVERHPVVAALLFDGLRRAYADTSIADITSRMHFHHRQSAAALSAFPQFSTDIIDVVYLDPMFPHRQKSALVKKEMRVFQSLVGDDMDADALLAPALALATKRVVVKRPDYAPPLDNQAPTYTIDTKKNRFDVYVNSAFT